MIGFPCMYCGHAVSAEDELVGKKIECPGCGHFVTAHPKQPVGTQESTADHSGDEESKDALFWEGKSDQEMAHWLDSHTVTRGQRTRLAAKRELSRSMARFDDLTLFALSFAFVLLYLIDHNVKKDLFLVSFLPRLRGILALALLGMVLCILSMFVRHRKYESEKRLMLLFAVLVTAGTGVYSGIIVIKGGIHWFIVFPAWNIINSVVLLGAYHAGIVDTNSITDERPGMVHVLITIASISLLLILCEHLLGLHWAITYSITISYTMSLLGAIRGLFGERNTEVL